MNSPFSTEVQSLKSKFSVCFLRRPILTKSGVPVMDALISARPGTRGRPKSVNSSLRPPTRRVLRSGFGHIRGWSSRGWALLYCMYYGYYSISLRSMYLWGDMSTKIFLLDEIYLCFAITSYYRMINVQYQFEHDMDHNWQLTTLGKNRGFLSKRVFWFVDISHNTR